MKEYSILIRYGNGVPYYYSLLYSNIFAAKKAVLDMVELEEKRNRLYFVDNDFFVNKYSYVGNGKYMSIQEREVSEWKKFSEVENKNTNNEKIIYLKNYFKNT